MKLGGYDAITYAEANGLTLCKYRDGKDEPRVGLTTAEAREIATRKPSLIWINDPKIDRVTTKPKTEKIYNKLQWTGWYETTAPSVALVNRVVTRLPARYAVDGGQNHGNDSITLHGPVARHTNPKNEVVIWRAQLP